MSIKWFLYTSCHFVLMSSAQVCCCVLLQFVAGMACRSLELYYLGVFDKICIFAYSQ